MLRSLRRTFLLCFVCLLRCNPLLAQYSTSDTTYADTAVTTSPTVVEEEAGMGDYGEYLSEDSNSGLVTYNGSHPSDAQWMQATSSDAYGYRDKKEYTKKYEPPPKAYEEPGWVKFLNWLYKFFSSGAGKFLLLCILALIIGFIAYRIIAGHGGGLFARRDRRKDADAEAEVSEQGLQEGAWESALRKALESGDTRAAIRFAWLHSLQLLQERGLIAYRQDKTNIQYYRELSEDLRSSFRALSRQYEFAWYGAMLPDAAGLNTYLDTYNNLKRSIGAA